MKSLLRKLHQQSGESLVEVLVSVLISSFALITLAMMVMTTTRLVTESKETFKDYVVKSNEIAARNGNIGKGTVTFKNGKNGDAAIQLYDSASSVKVTYHENDVIGGKGVISFDIPPATSTTSDTTTEGGS